MRRELVGIVALWARDAEIRRVLAAAAQRSLEDDAALDPLLRSRAWAVGVQSLAPAFRQAIETRLLESKDPQIRQDAAVALGYAEETESSRRVSTPHGSRIGTSGTLPIRERRPPLSSGRLQAARTRR